MSELLTIGHSTHPIDAFIALLKQHGVTALADVRSHPYSRHFPQYSKDALKNALAQAQIAYVFLGKELGARSENPACYRQGKVQYDLLAKEPLFAQGLERLRQGLEKYQMLSIAEFIRESVLRPRLKQFMDWLLLVVYDADKRYREQCFDLGADKVRVVDASESSIESREAALAGTARGGPAQSTD
jgi:hypothetical protein